METGNLNGKLNVFCPTHQSVFEVEYKPQIVCEIKEHSLSNNFPYAEFWEYCCDCRTFSPSSFGTGGKAKNNCPHCERPTAKRFLCSECKTIAYDSDEATKGKIYNVSAKDGITPNCAGCHKSSGSEKIYQHKCPDIETAFLTSRKDCPFCLKPVLLPPSPPKESETISGTQPAKSTDSSTQCPNCGHWGRADRNVCGKCGVHLKTPVGDIVAGSAVPKTQLLGSICPNCGTGNDADSLFCVNCGQALKAALQTSAATDQMAKATILPPNFSQNTSPNFQVKSEYKRYNPVYPVIIGGGIVFLIIIVLIAVNANKTSITNSNLSNYTTYGVNSNSSNANKMNVSNTSSPYIGRKGRLTTNLNIRSASNKYSEILGTHYENARVEILNEESYYADDGEYVTWYRIRILENGYDYKTGHGKGNNWERGDDFGWMQAEMEGWMNAKYISLE